ncbi:O-antigen ligase [Bacteroides sp.]|uniref:O-antigen ligase family protein n=1 Tax=Bacteroides sp. TaxID=29523 RepID=UPI002609EBA2|nr:O-antigen ligase family protein [Bacteroides sp.]
MGIKGYTISPLVATISILIIGLGAVAYSILFSAWDVIMYVCSIPFFLVILVQSFRNPFTGTCFLFTFNYFFLAWIRYTERTGLSVWYDIANVLMLIILIVYSGKQSEISWKKAQNILTIGGLAWGIYTVAEIANPTAVTEAWVYSRGTIYSTCLISLISVLVMTSYKRVRTIMLMLSIFTLIAITKAVYQKYVGFDNIEMEMLIETDMYRTHLLNDVTRYFSFFTDAGNFGSNMGFASILFGISAVFIKKKATKIYYIIVSVLSMYALFISGTRGSLFVPIGGVILFTFLSKKPKLMGATTIFGLCVYLFFAHTYIGESNASIRRMRTAFNPTKDASYRVRQENKKILANYLRHKPFGEGLGLGGVENIKYGSRLTTTTAHDSFYVKVWMETGIVGLILYLTIYLSTLLWGCYLIMFRIKNEELRGILTAIACGIFGLMVSAYGNAFFGQFPTVFIVIIFLSVLLNGKYIDQQLTEMLKPANKILNINKNNRKY